MKSLPKLSSYSKKPRRGQEWWHTLTGRWDYDFPLGYPLCVFKGSTGRKQYGYQYTTTWLCLCVAGFPWVQACLCRSVWLNIYSENKCRPPLERQLKISKKENKQCLFQGQNVLLCVDMWFAFFPSKMSETSQDKVIFLHGKQMYLACSTKPLYLVLPLWNEGLLNENGKKALFKIDTQSTGQLWDTRDMLALVITLHGPSQMQV